jgi:hypothetical protein
VPDHSPKRRGLYFKRYRSSSQCRDRSTPKPHRIGAPSSVGWWRKALD